MYFVGNYFKFGLILEEMIFVLLVVFWVVEFLIFVKDLFVVFLRLWNSVLILLCVSEILKIL